MLMYTWSKFIPMKSKTLSLNYPNPNRPQSNKIQEGEVKKMH